MTSHLTGWVRRAFRSASVRPTTTNPRPARLSLTPLEDRAVPAVLQGVAYYDLNRDSARGPGEPALAGGTVVLIDGRSGELGSTAVGPDGRYLFAGTPASAEAVEVYDASGAAVLLGERVPLLFDPDAVVTADLPCWPAGPVVTVARVSDAAEGGADGVFRFTRTGSTAAALTVSYSVPTVGPDYAAPGADYQSLSGTVTFAPGASTADVPVVVVDDTTPEPAEEVAVNLTAGAGYIVGGPGSDSVLIADNDPAPLVTVELAQGTLTFNLTASDGTKPYLSATSAANGAPYLLVTEPFDKDGKSHLTTSFKDVTNGVATLDDGTRLKFPPTAVIDFGASARGTFLEKGAVNKNAASDKFYWAQYIKYTFTSNSAKADADARTRPPGTTSPPPDGKWYADGPASALAVPGMPDFYASQAPVAEHRMGDDPGLALTVMSTDTGKVGALDLGLQPEEDGQRLYLVQLQQTPAQREQSALGQRRDDYGATFTSTQTWEYQSYVVEQATGKALGYVGWGFTMTTDVAKKQLGAVQLTAPVWKATPDAAVLFKALPVPAPGN